MVINHVFKYINFHIFTFILWLCLTRTGNYQIREFDWLKWILTAVYIFSHLDWHLDRQCFGVKKLQTKMKIIDSFHLKIFTPVSAKELMRKNSKVDEQTLKELNSAHCRSQAKCQLLQTNYMKQIK